MNNKILKLIRFALILLALIIVFFLVNKDLALSGHLSFKTDFKRFTPFISTLVPEERVIKGNNIYINQDPVYFNVALPRDFQKIILEFEYQNYFNNLLEIGLQVGETGLEFKPLENKILEKLNWPRLEDEGVILWQKEKRYQSINEFISNQPPLENIAVYNYDLAYNYKINNYKPIDKVLKINKSLNGIYQFYTYIKDETLDFEFTLTSQTEEINTNNATVNLYDFSDQLLNTFYPEENKIIVKTSDLPEGVYKIEMTAIDNIYTTQIITKQQYLSFINIINLISPVQLVTEAKYFTFTTHTNNGLQTLKVNDDELDIEEIWQQYNLETEANKSIITISKGNMVISATGLLAFSQNQYFNPVLNQIDQASDIDNQDINYIIARYNMSTAKNDFIGNKVEFDITPEKIEQAKLRFVISIPGLSESAKGIIIKDLKVKLLRESIWQEGIKQNIINYLKFYRDEIQK